MRRNWEAIGAIGEVTGAIAVIATLIYLSIQIRRNSASVRANAHQTWVTTAIAEQTAGIQIGMNEEFALGLHDPSALTNKSWVPFVNYCHLFMLKAESAYYLAKNGNMNQAIADKEMDRAAAFINATGPGQWWQAGARTQFTEEFMAEVEQRRQRPSSFQVYDFTAGVGFHPNRDESDANNSNS